jgi:hypothetical protein
MRGDSSVSELRKEAESMHRFLQIILLLVCLATTAFADVPRTLSYQGRLTDNSVAISGAKNVIFTIYSGSGAQVWSSGSISLSFNNGLFSVELGKSPQPSLPVEIWSADTALSLGVTIPPSSELAPRLRFSPAPYAFHALTAESAGSGGGWLHDQSFLRLENPYDTVGIGTDSPNAKVGISSDGEQVALRLSSPGTDGYSPVLDAENPSTTCAIFRAGHSDWVPGGLWPSVCAISTLADGSAIWAESESETQPSLYAVNSAKGDGIWAVSNYGYTIAASGALGILTQADSACALRAESYCDDQTAFVSTSLYAGTAVADHVAMFGYSKPTDNYGIGGVFEGGYEGVQAVVEAAGSSTYCGLQTQVSGGSGSNYGIYSSATGSAVNCALYATASGGTTNYAGYFSGNVRVTGSITNPTSVMSIDNPDDPQNGYLQQANVVSDNLKSVYDGTVVLGNDGTALVTLPSWLESFCGDFRYQLTCVGGFAPVYVSSEIAGNQFSIAGGTSGLKVCWQVTGIRKDKYALAHPLEVEKEKLVSEKGKYLHPELFGYGQDRSVNPDPQSSLAEKSKNDAVRTAAAEMAKPTAKAKKPVTVKKK